MSCPDHHHDPASQQHPEPRGGDSLPDTHVTIVGNLTDDPEVTFTPNGPPSATSGWP